MAWICLRVLDGFVPPVEWVLDVVVPLFKEKNDFCYCNIYGVMKLHEH